MRMFGLIGYPLSHSFSKNFFNGKFSREGLHNCIYENYEIPSIIEFVNLFRDFPSLEGLNVTIPYKQQVIQFLHGKNNIVESIGACNCIRIEQGRLYGFNTDTTGFELSLKNKLFPHHTNALVLGTGGAAKAVTYVLNKLQIEYLSVSRFASHNSNVVQYDEVTEEICKSHTLIINTTPLGMYPETETAPPINYDLLGPSHYLYDLVYNPEKTLFLRKGEEKGAAIENGYNMLTIQAEESWKIWNGFSK